MNFSQILKAISDFSEEETIKVSPEEITLKEIFFQTSQNNSYKVIITLLYEIFKEVIKIRKMLETKD